MADTQTVYILEDVIPYYEEIIDNQNTEIEHLNSIYEQLTDQVALEREQINGFTLIINYQYATIAILVISLVIALGWKVLNGWFFKGV